MDTYDSGPATLAIEQWVVRSLAGLAGFGSEADGVLTPGGSISNLLALLIARDSAAAGLASMPDGTAYRDSSQPVVLCSELAHFSVQRSCAALGLGEEAVIAIGCDDDFRMRLDLLEAELAKPGRTPIAVVATAGTTDYGSVDPIAAIASLARAHGAWVHVDAAYGFGALFSDRLAPLLAELPAADSVTLDLHKIGWQPAATSMLLVADRNRFASFGRSVDYLNPADDVDSGLDGLLGRSLQTTRRPDAVKVATTLTAYGRAGLGRMLDACHELAEAAAARVVADSNLELLAPVTLTTVVFRVTGPALDLDALQGEVRRRLLTSGRALIGRTRVPGPERRTGRGGVEADAAEPEHDGTGSRETARPGRGRGSRSTGLCFGEQRGSCVTSSVAVEAHLNAILRCYTRERSVQVSPGPLDLGVGGVTAVVQHASRTGLHQFTDVLVDGAPVAPEDLVRLLSSDADPAEIDDLAARTAESVRNVELFTADEGTRGPGRFLETEQALLFGHLNHPAPKSRDGLSGAELTAYSPELGGRFAVHWFEADAELVSSDQVAGAPSLQGLDALQLMAALAGITPADGTVLVPAHPWQASAVASRPRVAQLIAEGRVKPLGPLGAQWYPTSSLRTVYHPDLPVMLKLSLGLRITNSRRESTPTELRRGLEINRLLDAAYNAGTATAHPQFSIVRDPAWVALDEGGPTLTGLDVAVREVPSGVDDYACLAGLVAPRPGGRARLSDLAAGDPAGVGGVVRRPGAGADAASLCGDRHRAGGASAEHADPAERLAGRSLVAPIATTRATTSPRRTCMICWR